jgi:hypothetical protein
MTAVEFFFIELTKRGVPPHKEIVKCFEQAKEMEREQIIEAVDSVQLVQRYYYNDGTFGDDLMGKEVSAGSEREYFALSTTGEQYYKEKYL